MRRPTRPSLPNWPLATFGPSLALVFIYALTRDIGRKPQKTTKFGSDPSVKASWRFIRSWVAQNHKLYYTYVLVCKLYFLLIFARRLGRLPVLVVHRRWILPKKKQPRTTSIKFNVKIEIS